MSLLKISHYLLFLCTIRTHVNSQPHSIQFAHLLYCTGVEQNGRVSNLNGHVYKNVSKQNNKQNLNKHACIKKIFKLGIKTYRMH